MVQKSIAVSFYTDLVWLVFVDSISTSLLVI